MKVKISNYPNRLTCNIHSNHMNKKYGYVDWPKAQDYEDHVLEAIDDGIQRVYNSLKEQEEFDGQITLMPKDTNWVEIKYE